MTKDFMPTTSGRVHWRNMERDSQWWHSFMGSCFKALASPVKALRDG